VELYIYPTSRNIRQKYQEYHNDILPKCMTMDEFEKRAVIVDDKKYIDDDKRVLLLKKAADFSEFNALQIPRDYLSFLKSSKFLFGFFEELSLEFVDIDSIDKSDTYAEYSTHLQILKFLLQKYKNLLEKNGYYDKIVLPELYKINTDFLKRFSKVTLYLDGYLNNFEFELLHKISHLVTLQIIYQTNIFNQKMIKKFKELGISLESNHVYRVDLSSKQILFSKKLPSNIKKIEYLTLGSRTLQVGFVKKKVYDFLKAGIKPENIAVVTPDEEFALFLDKFDKTNIFNFAAGFSYKKSDIYKRVMSFYRYLEEKSYENIYRLKRYLKEMEEVDNYRYKIFDEVDFDTFMMKFVFEGDDEDEISLYKNELFKFKRVKEELKGAKLKDAIYLFLERLKESRLDDKNGGKITVIGLLETRLTKFEGVIVVDFNEEIVPKKSSKDIFLNTAVRKNAGLPTINDRENLQKNYYFKLFLNAKNVALCAVSNENEKISRFLDELPVDRLIKNDIDDKFIMDILFARGKTFDTEAKSDLFLKYDFKNFIFSNTSFKILLECKRRFFYQYIKKIREFDIPSNEVDEKMIGEKIHKALHSLFAQVDYFESEKVMFEKLKRLLSDEKDPVFRFRLDIWLEKLKLFTQNEIKRFEEGYRFYKGEMKLFGSIKGYKIQGSIDRVDTNQKDFILLDYKTGKINLTTSKTIQRATDFQMEFYYILAKQNGFDEISEVGFYDLNKATIVEENMLKEKLSILEEKFELLEGKEHNFSMCEDMKYCRFCPYKILCKRDDV